MTVLRYPGGIADHKERIFIGDALTLSIYSKPQAAL
jgi:hypothetical protein